MKEITFKLNRNEQLAIGELKTKLTAKEGKEPNFKYRFSFTANGTMIHVSEEGKDNWIDITDYTTRY